MKTFAVTISQSAMQDFFVAADYYFSISQSLGSKFEASFKSALKKLENDYKFYGYAGFKNLRRILLKQFPYKIVYAIDSENEIVIIVALVHTARSKGYMRRKLK